MVRRAAVAVSLTVAALLALAVGAVVIDALITAAVVVVAAIVGLYGRAYRLAFPDGKLAVARIIGGVLIPK